MSAALSKFMQDMFLAMWLEGTVLTSTTQDFKMIHFHKRWRFQRPQKDPIKQDNQKLLFVVSGSFILYFL